MLLLSVILLVVVVVVVDIVSNTISSSSSRQIYTLIHSLARSLNQTNYSSIDIKDPSIMSNLFLFLGRATDNGLQGTIVVHFRMSIPTEQEGYERLSRTIVDVSSTNVHWNIGIKDMKRTYLSFV